LVSLLPAVLQEKIYVYVSGRWTFERKN